MITGQPLPKIYGFFNGRLRNGQFLGISISQDGVMLTAVVAESLRGVISDLGLDAISRKHHRLYDEVYPDGWSGEFVMPLNYESHGHLQACIKMCENRKKQGVAYRFVSKKGLI